MAARLPNPASPFVDENGLLTPDSYSFLRDLSQYFIVGDGAPTITAPQGALYLRTDGSSVATRAYTSKGDGTWAAVTTTS